MTLKVHVRVDVALNIQIISISAFITGTVKGKDDCQGTCKCNSQRLEMHFDGKAVRKVWR